MYILNAGAMMKPFNESRDFMNVIVALLENSNAVIRGKAILTLLLLIKVNTKSLVYITEGKFFGILDKLVKDTYKYVQ